MEKWRGGEWEEWEEWENKKYASTSSLITSVVDIQTKLWKREKMSFAP